MIRHLRYKVRHNRNGISMDLKIRLLQKSGWLQDDRIYNRKDLVSLARTILKSSQAARDHGAEYLVDKWMIAKGDFSF
jgi:hypothetical protein